MVFSPTALWLLPGHFLPRLTPHGASVRPPARVLPSGGSCTDCSSVSSAPAPAPGPHPLLSLRTSSPHVLERQGALTNSHSPSAPISCVPSTMEDVCLCQRPRPRPGSGARDPMRHSCCLVATPTSLASHERCWLLSLSAANQARPPGPWAPPPHSSLCPAFSAFPAKHPSEGPTPRLHHPFTYNTFQPGCSPNTERVLKQNTRSTSIQKP